MDLAQEKLIDRHEAGHWDIGFSSRYRRTIRLLDPYMSREIRILDLGPDNYMRRMLIKHFKCSIIGTDELDLNYDFNEVANDDFDLITSFEVFEHLFNLFPLLSTLRRFNLPMICSVPLRFPLARQYWTEDYHDRHYNEFEPRQIRWILNEAGFRIAKEEMWYMDFNFRGVRPLLRTFLFPSWMALVCR
jgi:hypothetical protein